MEELFSQILDFCNQFSQEQIISLYVFSVALTAAISIAEKAVKTIIYSICGLAVLYFAKPDLFSSILKWLTVFSEKIQNL